MPPYQPKTGAKCSCKRGIQRDNCPNCEGTGMAIDFAAIRATTAHYRMRMFPLFVGESNDHISITDTEDCLQPDSIRIENRVFPDHKAVMDCVAAYEKRGFKVSVQYSSFEYFSVDKEQ